MASHIVSKLTKEYARLQGRYEVIDREIEYVVGVQQILAEIDRIEGVKRGTNCAEFSPVVIPAKAGTQPRASASEEKFPQRADAR